MRRACLTFLLSVLGLAPGSLAMEGPNRAQAGGAEAGAGNASVDPSVYSHFLNALLLERRGELDLALGEYDRTLQIDPKATVIYRQRAELHLKMGNPERALEDTQAYVHGHPDDVDALLLLSNIYLLNGQRQAARLVLEKILERHPDHEETLQSLATLEMTDNPLRAREVLERLVGVDPASVDGLYHLGLLYQREGETDKSREMFERAVEADPDALPSLFVLGQLSEKEGDIPSAISYYERALEEMPENFALRMQIVMLRAKNMELDEISRLLEPYADDPEAPLEANLWLGIAAEAGKDLDRALEFYRRADRQTRSPAVKIRLAGVYSRLGRARESLKTLSLLAGQDPGSAQYRYFLGLAYMDLKKPRRAIREFEAALRIKKDFSEAAFQIGVARDQLKDWDRAEQYFREAIRVDTANASAYNYIGYTYADRNVRLFEARRMIEKALELDTDNPAFVDSLGWLDYREGNYEAALRHLQEAAQAARDPVIQDHLGDCRLAMGRPEIAALHYAKSLEMAPGQKKVRKKLERLNRKMVPTAPARKALKQFQYRLRQATDVSGIVTAESGSGLFRQGGGRGFFYLRHTALSPGLSTGPVSTEMRVDLLDRTLLPGIVLRYRSLPKEKFTVFPPEVGPSLPGEIGEVMSAFASFMNGEILQEFDVPDTDIRKRWGGWELRNGERSLRIGMKRGLVTEIRNGSGTLHLDDYREVGGTWMPMAVRVVVRGAAGSGVRGLVLRFSHVSLEKIENRLFEAGR